MKVRGDISMAHKKEVKKEYNIKNKKAWFQTESMITRKPIEIKRVINL